MNKKLLAYILIPAIGIPAAGTAGVVAASQVPAIQDTNNELKQEIEDLKAQIEALQAQLAALTTAMQNESQAIRDEYTAKIDTINNQISDLQEQLTQLETQYKEEIATLTEQYKLDIDDLENDLADAVAELTTKIEDNTDKISKLEAEHKSDMSSLKEEYDAKIAKLESDISENEKSLREDYSSKISALETETNNKVTNLATSIADLEKQIDELKSKHTQDLKNLKIEYDKKIEAVESGSTVDIEDLKTEYEEKLQELEASFEQDLADLQDLVNKNTNEIESLKAKEASDIDLLTKQLNDAVEALEESLVGQKQALEKDYNEKLEALENDYNTKINSLNSLITEQKTALEKFQSQYVTDKEALTSAFNTKLTELKTTFETKSAEIVSSISSLSQDITDLESEMNKKLVEIQNDYNAKINDLITRISALENITYHTVTFDSDGGSSVPSQKVQHGEKATKPDDPIKNEHNFDGWYIDDDDKWSFNGYVVTEDITLTAHWGQALGYKITYVLNGGVNNPENPEYYTSEEEVVFKTPAKTGYTFLGWTDNSNQPISTIPFGSSGNIIVVAHWNTGNVFNLSLDPNGGTLDHNSINVQFDHEYTLPTPTRKGYEFKGWYDGDKYIENSGTWNYLSVTDLKAKWEIINYNISYNLNGGVNSDNNPSIYTVEDTITFAEPSKIGSTFTGWVDASNNPITGISKNSIGDVYVKATWKEIVYNFTAISSDTTKGTVTGSGQFTYQSPVTVTAIAATNYLFDGWYHGDELISVDPSYTFGMPAKDYGLVAKFANYDEVNRRNGMISTLNSSTNTITFGMYPQSHLSNQNLIDILEDKYSQQSGTTYIKLGNDYYAKTLAKPVASNYCFDDGTPIVSGTYYWFKVEAVSWNILSSTSNQYLGVTTRLLDTHVYNPTKDSVSYASSQLYYYLKNTFAQNCLQYCNYSSCLRTTTVDNSAATMDSTSNKHTSSSTNDMVFPLSYQDYLNPSYGFSSDIESSSTRVCKTTDYARAMGAYMSLDSYYFGNGKYWTRTPETGGSTISGFDAWAMNYDGSYVDLKCTTTSISIRVAATLIINS